MSARSNVDAQNTNRGGALLNPDSRQARLVRQRLERAFAWLTFSTVFVAISFLAVLVVDTAIDVFSWQIVAPAGSGATFAWHEAPLGGEAVIRMELIAQALALPGTTREEAEASAEAVLEDAEALRIFHARNRVELMPYTSDGPFRWTVTNSRDDIVEDIGLFGLNGYLRAVRGDLAEASPDALSPEEARLLDRLRDRSLVPGLGLRHADLAVASLAPGQTLVLNPWLDASFFSKNASRNPQMAGLKSAIVGTLWVVSLVLLIAVPLGVGSSVYLEEYAPNNRFTRFLEVNIRNLAGVPSIIYGILGLYVFVRLFGFGPTILPAALTLSLLILPVIIITGQEALRSVPESLRLASYGLGATRWQTVSRVVLPNAVAGIVTGVILAIARAIGETAPLLLIGAAAFVPFLPDGVFATYTVIPVQIYSWVGENQAEFRHAASAAILALLAILVVLYGLAFYLRRRFERAW